MRPTKALIDLSALRHNYAVAQRLSGGGRTLPIIKANAYGHGAVEVARALESSAPAFGVACFDEAMELRTAGIKKPLLLLQGALNAEELLEASRQQFWLVVGSEIQAEAVITAKLENPVSVWLKVDTGMHRLGVASQQFRTVYQQLSASNNVADMVLMTHFACSDETENNMTRQQLALFSETVQGIDAPMSLANSAGLIAWPESRAEWNRPGYMLYGCSPVNGSTTATQRLPEDTLPEDALPEDALRPVMTLSSQVIAVRDVPACDTVGYGGVWHAERDSRIATVTIGYGDGYPRHARSGTPVLVNGQRVPLVGRVSMDMITVDVTDLCVNQPEAVKPGDEVILWGGALSVNEVAECAGTIGYELLTRMPARTPRVYFDQ
jgi:alanine racemase